MVKTDLVLTKQRTQGLFERFLTRRKSRADDFRSAVVVQIEPATVGAQSLDDLRRQRRYPPIAGEIKRKIDFAVGANVADVAVDSLADFERPGQVRLVQHAPVLVFHN